MAQKGEHKDSSIGSTMAGLMPAEFVELGQKRMEALADINKEMLATFEQAREDWAKRVKLEADLASELATKLASAGSIPNAAKIYQEWLGRRMDLATKDAQKLMADSQKLMNASTRVLSGVPGTGSS